MWSMQAECDLMAKLKPSKNGWTPSCMVIASRMSFNGITEAKQECVEGIMLVNASRMRFNGITEAKQECVDDIMCGKCKQNVI